MNDKQKNNRPHCNNPDPRNVEMAFRRGYVQGAETAINALMEGKSAGNLEQWLSTVLRKWYDAPKGKAIKPPTP